LKNAVHVV